MSARALITASFALLATPAEAETISFTAGEHGDYSRVVVSGGASSVSSDEQARTVDVSFGKGAATFDLTEVAMARKAHRVASVKKIDSAAGSTIRLQLNCDCVVDTVRRSDGSMMLNIADRTAPGKQVSAAPLPKQTSAEADAEEEVSLEEARARMIELLQRAANDGLITIRKDEPAQAAKASSIALTAPQISEAAVGSQAQIAAQPASQPAQSRPCIQDAAFAIDGQRFEKEPLVEIALLQAELANTKGDAQAQTVKALAQGYLSIGFGDEALALLTDHGAGESILADLARITSEKAPSENSLLLGAQRCTGEHALWLAAASEPAEAAEAARMSGEAITTLPKRLRATIATQIAGKMIAAGAWTEAQHFYRIASEASEAPSEDLKFVAAELLEHDGDKEESQKMLLDLSKGDAEASRAALLALARRYSDGAKPHEGYVDDIGALAFAERGSAAGAEAAYREAMLWADSGNVEASVLLLRNATGSSLGAAGLASRQARELLAAAFQSADDGKRASALSAYLDHRDFLAPDAALTREAARAAMEIGLPNAALDILRASDSVSDKPGALLAAKAALAAGDGEAALKAAAPFASDPEFAALVVDAHLSLNRSSAALAAASAFAGASERAAQTARAAWNAGDWASAARAYHGIDPNEMSEKAAVEFVLASYMAGERVMPPTAEAALVKHQSKSVDGLKALFSAPSNGPLVERLKSLVHDADAELKLIEEMRGNG